MGLFKNLLCCVGFMTLVYNPLCAVDKSCHIVADVTRMDRDVKISVLPIDGNPYFVKGYLEFIKNKLEEVGCEKIDTVDINGSEEATLEQSKLFARYRERIRYPRVIALNKIPPPLDTLEIRDGTIFYVALDVEEWRFPQILCMIPFGIGGSAYSTATMMFRIEISDSDGNILATGYTERNIGAIVDPILHYYFEWGHAKALLWR